MLHLPKGVATVTLQNKDDMILIFEYTVYPYNYKFISSPSTHGETDMLT
jgi:hypothetical protein